MKAMIDVDQGTERLRDGAIALLSVLYLLPAVFTLPPYLNITLTASLTVASACLRTVGKTNEAEILSKKEAMKFPIIGSVSLFGLFLAIKFLPKHWLTYIITFYFCLVGTFALGELILSTFWKFIPESVRSKDVLNLKQVTIPLIMPEPEDIKVTVPRLIANLFGLAFTVWYAATKHFLANNGLGLSYCIEGIAMLSLGSTQVGMILLWGLFVYDIFWVFFTPVMVTVAKNIDGPIKLLFPITHTWKEFSMLGLGDIVIPGLFVALMLRFDAKSGSGKKYFFASMVGYSVGLTATLVAMYAAKHAQPALLYIVPAVTGSVFIRACLEGQVKELWNFSDEKPEEEADPTAEGSIEETKKGQ